MKFVMSLMALVLSASVSHALTLKDVVVGLDYSDGPEAQLSYPCTSYQDIVSCNDLVTLNYLCRITLDVSLERGLTCTVAKGERVQFGVIKNDSLHADWTLPGTGHMKVEYDMERVKLVEEKTANGSSKWKVQVD